MDAGFLFDKPVFGSADAFCASGFAFEQKRCAVGDLGERGIDAEIPDRGGDQVVAGFQEGREVESFVAPVCEVAPGRAVAGTLAIHIQNEAIINVLFIALILKVLY